MADKIWFFVLTPMVYIAVVWCVTLIVIRIAIILRAPKLPRPLKIFPEHGDPDDTSGGSLAAALWDTLTMPSVRRYEPVLWCFLVLFHVAILTLILAHLDLHPRVNIMAADSEHMIGNGALGIIVTVSLLYLLFRRFRSPVREASVPADYLLLLLLISIAVSGDIISWGNSWSEEGFVMTKADFGLYVESLVSFSFADPREFLTGSHYAIIGVHVLLANLFLMILPFSKITHTFFALPLNKLRRG